MSDESTDTAAVEYTTMLMKFGHHDAGNSRRFTSRFRGRLIYVRGPGWHRWTGHVWTPVGVDELLREAKMVAKKIWDEVQLAEDDKQRAAIASHAYRSASRGRLEAMVKLAAAGEIRGEDLKIGGASSLDRNRDILNTPSGIVDLATGRLLDHEEHKEEYCTRMTRVGYSPHAPMKGWNDFLATFWPDLGIRDTLQLMAGASATGYSLKALVCLIGPGGDNGKTTIVEAIKSTLGTYGATAMEATFTNANAREAQYDLAALRGARFVAFSETREGYGLAAERVKRVTGGDQISARAAYGKPFEYKPGFTLWMPTNNAPKIPAGDKAMWRRIWAVPCTEQIAPDAQIQDYAEVLVRQHGAGILRWIVEGARRFYAAGAKLPRQPSGMRTYVASWRDRDDIVKRWLEERTDPEPGSKVSFNLLYQDFRLWAEDNGEQALLRDYPSQRFHKELDEHYNRSEGKSKGYYQRLGIRLRSLTG